MLNTLLKSTPLLLIATLSGPSWGDESSAGFLSSYRFTLWASGYIGEFMVFDKEESPAAGVLSKDYGFTPYLSLHSPSRYFGESDIAFSTRYNFSSFSLDKQLVSEAEVDLGTSVDGYSVFVAPIVSIPFPGRDRQGVDSLWGAFGVGFGLGYMNATGDVIFTETTRQRESIDISGPALAMSVFGDLRHGNFIYQFALDMTSVFSGDTEYRYTGYSLKFGYVFEL